MRVYIVAPDYAEARELAARYELGHNEWRWVHSHEDLRGLRCPQVIQSNCFGLRRIGDFPSRVDIYQQLDITQARVAIVPCRVKP